MDAVHQVASHADGWCWHSLKSAANHSKIHLANLSLQRIFVEFFFGEHVCPAFGALDLSRDSACGSGGAFFCSFGAGETCRVGQVPSLARPSSSWQEQATRLASFVTSFLGVYSYFSPWQHGCTSGAVAIAVPAPRPSSVGPPANSSTGPENGKPRVVASDRSVRSDALCSVRSVLVGKGLICDTKSDSFATPPPPCIPLMYDTKSLSFATQTHTHI